MNEAAPQILVALEASGIGFAIRESKWIYPAANVTHVVALALFAAAVVVMDLRLLGAFRATRPRDVIVPARRATVAALLLLIASGAVLFTAEASHVALNPVFQVKGALVAVGLLNALTLARVGREDLADMVPGEAFPPRVRLAAVVSLLVWLAVAASGRLIAYF